MDAWFAQQDVLANVAKPIGEDGFIAVYHYHGSCLEHFYWSLRTCSRRYAKRVLDNPAYGLDRSSVLTERYVSNRSGYVGRFKRHWIKSAGLSEYGARLQDHNGNLVGSTSGTSGKWESESRISLRFDLLQADLESQRRVGVLCFSCYRYSERSLSELFVQAGEDRIRNDRMTYVQVYETRNDDRFRMTSRSMVMGKAIVFP